MSAHIGSVFFEGSKAASSVFLGSDVTQQPWIGLAVVMLQVFCSIVGQLAPQLTANDLSSAWRRCDQVLSTMAASFPTNQAIVVGGGLGGGYFSTREMCKHFPTKSFLGIHGEACQQPTRWLRMAAESSCWWLVAGVGCKWVSREETGHDTSTNSTGQSFRCSCPKC